MTHAMEMRLQERLFRLAGFLLLLVFGSYQGAVSWQFYQQMRGPENLIRDGFIVDGPWPSVRSVSPRAAEAGLRGGDRLLEVHGQRYTGEAARQRIMDKYFPGDRIRLTVSGADGTRREVTWQLEASRGGNMPWSRILFLALMTIGMPLLCLIVGFWVVMARPADKQAWLLMGMLASFPHVIVHPSFLPGPEWLAAVLYEMHPLMRSLWPLFLFWFAWEFPRRAEWQDRHAWLLRGTLVVLLAGTLLQMAESIAKDWGDAAQWAGFITAASRAAGIRQFLGMAAVGGFFALLFHKRFTLKDPDSKRRLQTILNGAMLLLIVSAFVLGGSLDSQANWLLVPALMAMCLFPVTLANVIIAHRAFGLSMVIRQGLQYALARRGVRVLRVMLIVGVLLTAVVLAVQPGLNRPKILQVVAIGTLMVLGLRTAAERLAVWVDRRFFREAYNAEFLLASLSDDVRTMVEPRPLLEAVATRIGEALHVERIALLLREGAVFQPAFAIGFADGGGAPLPDTAKTAEVMRRDRVPLRVYLDDTNSWIYREGLSPEETAWLRSTGAELLLPLAVKDKLLGFVSMGRKRSEEPYSENDLRLLQSVALQTGLAMENSQLAAAITEAVAQRERLNREVEIAHEMQAMLFPQNLPVIAGLDYYGYCRPARGVRGDSYDFMVLDSGVIAISIGDVSGKGIPAALLMASLQSALRGQAMSIPPDLCVMIGNLNRLIFDSSPSNRYATLFYSQYDPATRMLTYVNGGHCPPMVLRGDSTLRLEDGGPVVGQFRAARFVQGRFQLERGDVFVGFTDGISEAMNAADEEWGEEALGLFLQTCRADPAREMIPKIVSAADAFAGGFPQHDDMTLIVVRFL